MRVTWAGLDPSNLGQAKVVPELMVPGVLPHLIPHGKSGETVTAQGFLNRFGPRIVAEWTGDVGEAWAIINKTVPHQLYDAMIISSSDREVKPSVADLSPRERREMLRLIHGFVHYISGPNTIDSYGLDRSFFLASVNFNPDNADREGLQPVPRIHFHLNPMPWDQLKDLPDRAVLLGSIKSARMRRRLVDPLSPLGVTMINHLLQDLEGDLIELCRWTPEALIDSGRPIGFHARLRKGWDTLLDPGLGDLMAEIHRRLDCVYRRLRRAFLGTDEDFLVWERHSLLPRRQIKDQIWDMNEFPVAVRNKLCLLADLLRDIPTATVNKLKPYPERQELMAIEGLAYAMGFYADELNERQLPLNNSNSVYLLLQAKLFASSGGAGVIGVQGVNAVLLCRDSGGTFYGEEEWNNRTLFLQAYARHVGLPLGRATRS